MDKVVTKLINKEKKAINKFGETLVNQFPDAKIILFGSKARGEADKFSDIDLLVLLNQSVNTKVEEAIYRIAFEIGLEFSVVLSIVVESKDFFKSPLARAMPFFKNIRQEGIAV